MVHELVYMFSCVQSHVYRSKWCKDGVSNVASPCVQQGLHEMPSTPSNKGVSSSLTCYIHDKLSHLIKVYYLLLRIKCCTREYLHLKYSHLYITYCEIIYDGVNYCMNKYPRNYIVLLYGLHVSSVPYEPCFLCLHISRETVRKQKQLFDTFIQKLFAKYVLQIQSQNY